MSYISIWEIINKNFIDSVYTLIFFWIYYQNLDFENATSDYFNQELGEGLFAIYDQNGNPNFDVSALQTISEPDNRNLIGAPFHFYFGTKVGNSALDLFIRKYGN